MYATSPELLDCRHESVVNDSRSTIRNHQALARIPRTDSTLSVRLAGGVEEGRSDRVRAAEESAVAYRLRLMLSRQLQSMGIPGNRRASMRDKRAGASRDLWLSGWRL